MKELTGFENIEPNSVAAYLDLQEMRATMDDTVCGKP